MTNIFLLSRVFEGQGEAVTHVLVSAQSRMHVRRGCRQRLHETSLLTFMCDRIGICRRQGDRRLKTGLCSCLDGRQDRNKLHAWTFVYPCWQSREVRLHPLHQDDIEILVLANKTEETFRGIESGVRKEYRWLVVYHDPFFYGSTSQL